MKPITEPQTELAGREIFRALRGKISGENQKRKRNEKACQDYFFSMKEYVFDEFVEALFYYLDYKVFSEHQKEYIKDNLDEFYFYLYDHAKDNLFGEMFDAELDDLGGAALSSRQTTELIEKRARGEITSNTIEMAAIYNLVIRSEFDRFSFWTESELQTNTRYLFISELLFLLKFSGFAEIVVGFCPSDRRQRRLFN